MNNNFEIYETPMGEISMACFNENGTCIFYANLDHLRPEEILDMISDLEEGADPTYWEGSDMPEENYEEITSYESGAEIIVDNCGYYYSKMGAQGKAIFLCVLRPYM